MATSNYVGIDVSKDRLDVAMLGEERVWQVNNTPEGIDELVQQMHQICPELIVVEATGGYQRAVVERLFLAGLAVAVVNPARVRQFARACGLMAKTDKLDALVLAEFGQRVQPRRYESKSEAGKQLRCFVGEAQAAGGDAEGRAEPLANVFTKLARLAGANNCLLEGREENAG